MLFRSVGRLVFGLAVDVMNTVGRSTRAMPVQLVWICTLLPGMWFAGSKPEMVLSTSPLQAIAIAELAAVGAMLPALAIQLHRSQIALAPLLRHIATPVAASVSFALILCGGRQFGATAMLAATVLGAALYLSFLSRWLPSSMSLSLQK